MHLKHRFIWSILALTIASNSHAAQSQPLPSEQTVGAIEQVFAFHDAMPTGISVAENGRIFVNFPRWGDAVPFTVGELREGKVVPYPTLTWP